VIEGFTITSDGEEMDLSAIHAFLSSSYWAKGIPRETMQRALENSLCFGVFNASGSQIGFARAISDFATYAYIADVYVLEEYRGMGLSKWLMQEVMTHPGLQGLRRITLATQDAHGLYEKYGFEPLAKPEIFMETCNPSVYNNL
jgi:ribosomal protein S18 acetylase RimI-like enzyme